MENMKDEQTGAFNKESVPLAEPELFDPIYAFATWTDVELRNKLDEYHLLDEQELDSNWRDEIERQKEHITLELAYRKISTTNDGE